MLAVYGALPQTVITTLPVKRQFSVINQNFLSDSSKFPKSDFPQFILKHNRCPRACPQSTGICNHQLALESLPGSWDICQLVAWQHLAKKQFAV